MKAAQESRFRRAEELYIFSYRICTELDDKNLAVKDIISVSYMNQEIPLETVNLEKMISSINSWIDGTRDSTQAPYRDEHLRADLDSLRKYPRVGIKGWYVKLAGKGFEIVSDRELQEIRSKRIQFQNRASELSVYLSERMFKSEPSLAWTQAKNNGGNLYKVKVIYTNLNTDLFDDCQIRTELGEAPHHLGIEFIAKQMLRGETGIPEIDCLYPIGASTTSIANMTFFYADKLGAEGIWLGKRLTADTVWKAGTHKPASVPTGTPVFDCKVNPEDENSDGIEFTMLSDKHAYLRAPKQAKKDLMPGKLSNYKGMILKGPVLDLPEYDGIVAFVPETAFKHIVHNCGFDDEATTLKIISPFMKGLVRSLPDKDYSRHFPFSQTDFTCVFIKKSVSAEKITNRFVCNNEECPEYGNMLPSHNEDIPTCPSCGSSMQGCTDKVNVCMNNLCEHRGEISEGETCIHCGKDTFEFDRGIVMGGLFGQHNSDARKGKPESRVSHQIIIRGAIDKAMMSKKLIEQLQELHNIAQNLWLYPNAKCCENVKIAGETYHETTLLRDKLCQLMNLRIKAGTESYRGATTLLTAGCYPGSPRVIPRIAEVLAQKVIEAKQSITLPAKKVGNKTIRYASPYAVPGFDLQENQIRIPKYLNSLLMTGKEGKKFITLLRYPIRPGGTDMCTMEVVGESYGNVVEVHPVPWNNMEGDFDGDVACLIPVWITGKCVQTECKNPVAERTKDPTSVQEVIELCIAAYKGKHAIGPVDVKNSLIITEFECQGEPITVEEGLYLRERQQHTLSAQKHDVGTFVKEAPTERLKALFAAKTKYPANPVHTCLYFNPKKSRPTKGLLEFCRKFNLRIPASGANNMAWLEILQHYAGYITTQWCKENPDEAYKVLKHPYLNVLKAFMRVDLTALKRVAGLDYMYDSTFKVLSERAIKDLLTAGYSYKHLAEAERLCQKIKKDCAQYSQSVNKWKGSRYEDDGLSFSSSDRWADVVAECTQFRKDISVDLQKFCMLDAKLFALMHRVIWLSAGMRTYSPSPSFIFYAADTYILKEVFDEYSRINEKYGIDERSYAIVRQYLQNHTRLVSHGLATAKQGVVK